MAGEFYGLKTSSLENGLLRIEFLAEAGPRIVRLQLSGSDENLLAELPYMTKQTPFGEYFFRGGHRLWHAPENFPLSYIPDNAGLVAEANADGVRLLQPTEALTGLQKSIEIRLDPSRPALTLYHVLQNNGAEPVQAAPWAITQLPLGGTVLLPQQADPMDKERVLPNRNLVLWPYTEWDDPRLKRSDDYVFVQAEPSTAPFKAGYLNHAGWMGNVRNGILFLKRFEAMVHEPHADLSCNAEVHSWDRFIELETLGPLSGWSPAKPSSIPRYGRFTRGWTERSTCREFEPWPAAPDSLPSVSFAQSEPLSLKQIQFCTAGCIWGIVPERRKTTRSTKVTQPPRSAAPGHANIAPKRAEFHLKQRFALWLRKSCASDTVSCDVADWSASFL